MRSWDASALVPLFMVQAETPASRQLHQADPTICAWWGSRVECVSAIQRALREGRLDTRSAASARAALHQLWESVQEIAPTEDVRTRAERCLAVHALRAADALQVGAALVWARDRPEGMAFVSLDARLRGAASREGFTILPANV